MPSHQGLRRRSRICRAPWPCDTAKTPPRNLHPEREAFAMSIAHVDDFAPSIEEELHEVLVAAGLQGRQARAVAARLGWDGRGGCTLAVAARVEGYSRE